MKRIKNLKNKKKMLPYNFFAHFSSFIIYIIERKMNVISEKDQRNENKSTHMPTSGDDDAIQYTRYTLVINIYDEAFCNYISLNVTQFVVVDCC